MFGYVVIDKPELKIKEYDTYKAVYCSLCRRMGKDYGPFSRLNLSYDFTFAALLWLSLNARDNCSFEKKCCVANPLKKCVYCKNDLDGFELISAMAILLTEYKIRDNIADNGFFKSLAFRCIHPFAKLNGKKAAKKHPELKKLLVDYEIGQKAVENKNTQSVDEAADPTASMMKSFFTLLSGNSAAAGYLGYCIGKWIYLMDAADDIEDDIKKGSYSPFSIGAAKAEDCKEYVKNISEPNLNICRVEAAKAFELLDTGDFKPIIGNIIYLGIGKRQEKVLDRKGEDKRNEKSV